MPHATCSSSPDAPGQPIAGRRFRRNQAGARYRAGGRRATMATFPLNPMSVRSDHGGAFRMLVQARHVLLPPRRQEPRGADAADLRRTVEHRARQRDDQSRVRRRTRSPRRSLRSHSCTTPARSSSDPETCAGSGRLWAAFRSGCCRLPTDRWPSAVRGRCRRQGRLTPRGSDALLVAPPAGGSANCTWTAPEMPGATTGPDG